MTGTASSRGACTGRFARCSRRRHPRCRRTDSTSWRYGPRAPFLVEAVGATFDETADALWQHEAELAKAQDDAVTRREIEAKVETAVSEGQLKRGDLLKPS